MLITAPPRLARSGLDPLAAMRSARDLPLPDPAEIVRYADVARRVDAGLGAASDAVRGALDHLPRALDHLPAALEDLPGRRRRRRRRPLVMAGLLVGVLAALGVTTWWARRNAAAATRDVVVAEDVELELDRAAGEDVPARTETMVAAVAAVPNGEIHELLAVERLA